MMNYIEIAMNASLIIGTFFCFVASLGILRLPDVFLRIHAATKASTLGMIFLGSATALKFWSDPNFTSALAKCLMIIVFLFLTTPVSAHLIGRAAKARKNPMSGNTSLDEYDL